VFADDVSDDVVQDSPASVSVPTVVSIYLSLGSSFALKIIKLEIKDTRSFSYYLL